MANRFRDDRPANIVGGFGVERDVDFKQGMTHMLESFGNSSNLDPVDDIARILKFDVTRESYKAQLLGDILEESALAEDPYLAMMPAKLEQLFENTAMEIIEESALGQLAPVVGVSLPLLKKNFLEMHSKDIVMTEIPDNPIIKVGFERRFLRDKAGKKYYIPDIFYDESYKQVIGEMSGRPISSAWYPKAGGTFPLQDLNILEESGGTLASRDELALDFIIEAVKMNIGTEAAPNEVEVTGLRIVPDTGVTGGAGIGSFSYRVNYTHTDGELHSDVLMGQVTFYDGKISVASSGGKITHVRFGGHLSNQNNQNSVDISKEVENISWQIPDGKRINTGITIEQIKDYRAMGRGDLTTELISDLSTTLTHIEDSTIMTYLEDTFNTWKTKKDLPFGYKDGFVESYVFKATPPANVPIAPSMWVQTEMKYFMNRQIDKLKVKLRTTDIMFVVYGHPNNITLLQDDVRWVISQDTKVGGIQLDYQFGVMTQNQNRIHVVSSMKVPEERGIRIVAYPTSKEVITFKHYKYSLNIENYYRNPMTPLTPNVMGTSRYLTTHVLPVQGEFKLTDNEFGRQKL